MRWAKQQTSWPPSPPHAGIRFVLGLLLGECLLRDADLSVTLQSINMSATDGKTVAMKPLKATETMRTDDSFPLFWEKVLKKSRNVHTDKPTLPRRRRLPVRFEERISRRYKTALQANIP